MKKGYLILIMTLFFSTICYGQHVYLGLGNTQTTDLYIWGDTIYAATYNGIYKRDKLSYDTSWIPCGMQGNHVVQIVATSYSTFVTVVEIGHSRKTRIHKSTDGGNTFTLLLPDTSVVNNYQYLDHMACPGYSADTIYSLFHKKRTFNGGSTWIPINAFSIRFIKVHPLFKNQVYMGGETMIFSAELKNSYDYANTFTPVNMAGYFYGDNSVHDLEFSGNRWIAVGEGVISYTDNYGNNWYQAINTWSYPQPWPMYILDIEKSLHNMFYASGESGSANRVGLFISDDNGSRWDTVSFNSFKNTNPSIKCLAVYSDNYGDNVFMGGIGVYLFKSEFLTGVASDYPGNLISVYPNPSASGCFYIKINDKDVTIDSWSIANMIGNAILSGFNNSFTIDAEGTYILTINTNQGIVRKKIICI